jgi:dihydroneopterin aldolase
MKNDQICVWAPSKIVLDAVDGPSASPRDALALAAWFAREIKAKELLVIGASAPESAVPTRAISIETVDLR